MIARSEALTTPWYLRLLPRTLACAWIGAALLTTTAVAGVVEAWASTALRSESAQVGAALSAAGLLAAAAGLVLGSSRRLGMTWLASSALAVHGLALVSVGVPLGILFMGVAPLGYAFAHASLPRPRVRTA